MTEQAIKPVLGTDLGHSEAEFAIAPLISARKLRTIRIWVAAYGR
jgi:hypothetical protein